MEAFFAEPSFGFAIFFFGSDAAHGSGQHSRLITRLSVIPDLKNVWLTKSELGIVAGRPIVSFTILADVRQSGATS